MSRYYSPEFLNELKSKANIVEIVSSYTQVEKIGENYIARCPFHQDQTPSLQLTVKTNTFYCHACTAGSRTHSTVKACDALAFVRYLHNFNFPQAVEELAKKVGVPLPPQSREEQQKLHEKAQYDEYMNKVAETFHFALKSSQESLFYLGNRGITDLDIDIWKLGFGGNSPHKDFYNVKNRIVFPVFDFHGKVVSFTGRVFVSGILLDQLNNKRKAEGKSFVPKYRDMKNFAKSNNLYGIHIAKDYIRSTRTAILTEGWTDVIAMHRHGLKHTVSTMGVSLSEEQVELLKRAGANKVILMRDGDVAGMLATERDVKLLKKHDIECFIYPLQEGMDPDDLCLKFGYYNENLVKHINNSVQRIGQYKISKIYKETQELILDQYEIINRTQEDRIEDVLEVLLTIKDPVELDIYIRQVAELFIISYDTIKVKLNEKKQLELKEISNAQQNNATNLAFQRPTG